MMILIRKVLSTQTLAGGLCEDHVVSTDQKQKIQGKYKELSYG